MAAMKISKEPPTQRRRGIDPPSSVGASPRSDTNFPGARVGSPALSKELPKVRSPLPSREIGLVHQIFPIPHVNTDKNSLELSRTMATGRPASFAVDPSFTLASRDTSWMSMIGATTAKEQPELRTPRSSMHLTNNTSGQLVLKKPRKAVRYSSISIYEHDLEQAPRQEHVSFELAEYEAHRGERRPPKFFQKSDLERQSLRKLRQEEERQAAQEWHDIRQETMSIEEEASIVSARSSKSEAASFANASFYEGFEDRFKIPKKKSRLATRFGRFFRRRLGGDRETKSMIG